MHHDRNIPPEHSPRRQFLKRLAMFLFGVGIGLVFLSMIQRCKQLSAPPPGPNAQQTSSNSNEPAGQLADPSPAPD